jgi:tetratricopeptide (TPR) repeat protein
MNCTRRRVWPAVLGLLLCACSPQSGNAPPAQSTAAPSPAPAPVSATAPPATPGPTLAQWAHGAQLFDNLGGYSRTITTSSPDAQAYFNQGLRLIYAFNHDEAARAFAKAIEFDAACAMCYWGAGESLGPNYNMPAMADRWAVLWQAVQSAQNNAAHATPVEQALIAALATRYSGPDPLPAEKMQPFNEAYAKAMSDVARQYPDDDDVQVFHAEALMTANPWKLWSVDGKPSPGTAEIVATLETVLARNPQHPGANHYYIHAVEASPNPERALAYANLLPSLTPPIGHLVHMPAHIYIRTGDYLAAEETCVRAAHVDDSHLQDSPNMFTVLSYLHDLYFAVAAASMDGHYLSAKEAADKLAARVSPHVQKMPELQAFLTVQPTALVRFHRWNDILKLPQPSGSLKIANSMWHFARGMAFAAIGEVPEAEAEHKALTEAWENTASSEIFAMSANNKTRDILKIASDVLAAKLATVTHEKSQAVAQLRDAVAIQDTLKYGEPPGWFYPVRESLGAALFLDGQISEAEQTFREDLKRNPRNPRSLFGLLQILRSSARSHDASFVQAEFDAAWKGDLQQLNLQNF